MGRNKRGLDDCMSRHDYIQYVKDTEQGMVQYREHSNYAGIATARGALGIHDDNKTLPKEDRIYLKMALLAIGIAVALFVLYPALAPVVAQAFALVSALAG